MGLGARTRLPIAPPRSLGVGSLAFTSFISPTKAKERQIWVLELLGVWGCRPRTDGSGSQGLAGDEDHSLPYGLLTSEHV